MKAIAILAVLFAGAAPGGQLIPFDGGWTFVRGGTERTVDLPHDWMVESPIDPKGDHDTAHFTDCWGEGVYRRRFGLGDGRWSLCFDGAMNRAVVLFNGTALQTNEYGYTSFEVVLPEALVRKGTNEVEVRVSVERHGSRFYAGAGIYRNVRLRRIAPGEGPYYEHPAVRPLPLPKKLNGVNLHADNGPLGMAATAESIRRQLTIMREMGVNAIRTSHNPASPLFLDIAGEMGFFVLEEAFDFWNEPKTKAGYGRRFAENWEKDLRAMVRRDRGRPHVVVWSTGNEMVEQSPRYVAEHGTAAGVAFGKRLREIVREEDPYRPVTCACWNPASVTNGFDTVGDVFSANYMPWCYGLFLERHPGVGILGAETCSTLSSRGEYFFPLDVRFVREPGLYTNGFQRGQVSSYDLSSVRRHNYSPDIEFRYQDELPQVMGEFVWTGMDYLSEPSPYDFEARSSYYGIVDLCGFPKDRFYIYQAKWRPDFPMAHILPHWTWPGREGQVTPVHVYSSGDEAELFVNGVSQGRLRRGRDEYRFMWNDVVYAPGELAVKTWKNGRPWAEDRVVTAGEPAAVEIRQEEGFPSYYRVTAVDGRGNFCPTASVRVRIVTTGGWRVRAVANGNPMDHTPFAGTDTIRTFNGLAQVIVEKRGSGTVRAVRVE